jgi:hypothetical protein
MLSDPVTAEHPRLLDTELLEPEASIDDAARIAQAIAERMSSEWRKCVDQEQRQRRLAASCGDFTLLPSGTDGR